MRLWLTTIALAIVRNARVYFDVFAVAYLISAITEGSEAERSIVVVLLSYALVVLALEIVMASINSFYERKIIDVENKIWNSHIPNPDCTQISNAAGDYQHAFLDRLPSLVRIQSTILSKWVDISFVILAIAIMGIRSETFVVPVMLFVFMMIPSFMAGRFKQSEIKDAIHGKHESAVNAINGCSYFIQRTRDMFINVCANDSGKPGAIHANIGERYFFSSRKLVKLFLKKSCFTVLAVSAPSMMVVCLILYFAYKGHISVAVMFAWIMIADKASGLSRSLKQIIELRDKLDKSQELINICIVKLCRPHHSDVLENISLDLKTTWFLLRDGSKVSFSGKSEINIICASNGSGKSTLMNYILGIETNCFSWDSNALESVRNYFIGHSRTIERNPYIGNYKTMASAIYCDEKRSEGLADVYSAAREILPEEDQIFWSVRFSEMSEKWQESGYRHSDGELVILSIARLFTSLNCTVRGIFIDEVDMYLDKSCRMFFNRLLHILADKYSVNIITHDPFYFRSVHKVDLFCSRIVGYYPESNKGVVFPVLLTALRSKCPGVAKHGSLAKEMSNTIDHAFSVLIRSDPSMSILHNYQIQVYCTSDHYSVGHARSAGLGFAICFVGLASVLTGRKIESKICGTGILNNRGDVLETSYTDEKAKAVKRNWTLYTHKEINSLSQLTSIVKL